MGGIDLQLISDALDQGSLVSVETNHGDTMIRKQGYQPVVQIPGGTDLCIAPEHPGLNQPVGIGTVPMYDETSFTAVSGDCPGERGQKDTVVEMIMVDNCNIVHA